MTTLRSIQVFTFIPAAVAALALAACNDQVQPTEPTVPLSSKPSLVVAAPQITPTLSGPVIVPRSDVTTAVGQVAICKSGATGHIDVVIRQQGTGAGTVPRPTDPIVFDETLTLLTGQCAVFRASASQQFTFHAHEAQQFTVGATTTFLDNITAFTIGNTTTAVPCGSSATDLCAINMGPGNVTVGGVQFGPGSVIFGELNAFHGGLATFFNREQTHPCDFITFGRLIFETNAGKIVVSGNAGGFAAGGRILGEIQIEVGKSKYHVHDITSYSLPTAGGPFVGDPYAREIRGTATTGQSVDLRLHDNPNPGQGEPSTREGDAVYLKIGSSIILGSATAGRPVDQGNIQLHLNCRGAAAPVLE